MNLLRYCRAVCLLCLLIWFSSWLGRVTSPETIQRAVPAGLPVDVGIPPPVVATEASAVITEPGQIQPMLARESSLASALDGVRRVVQPLTARESGLPENAGVRFFAAHPGQALTARFRGGEMVLGSGRSGSSWSAVLRWLNPAAPESKPLPSKTAAGRVEYAHAGGVLEWYENRPEGLEHGFVVQRGETVSTPGESEIRLSLSVAGLQSRSAGEAVDFVEAASARPVFRYGKLKVWDSQGKVLDSHLEATQAGADIVIAAAGAVYPLMVDPLITSLEAVLTPEFTGDGAPQDRLANSVVLVGDTALMGMPNDDTAGGINAGSVYVFTRTAGVWTQQTRLTAADGAGEDLFGYSVAMSGTSVLVGAYKDDHPSLADAGSAYVFTLSGSTWSQEQKLVAADGSAGDQFGLAVGLSGDTAVIGAPLDEPVGSLASSQHGSANIFTRSGGVWSLQQKLVAGDAVLGDNYGTSVAIMGDTALVGAPTADVSSRSNSGAAYAHVRSGTTWTQQRKFSPTDAAASDRFGHSVALSGETALISAQLDDHVLPDIVDAGSAYAFLRSGITWSQQAKLVASDAGGKDRFGTSVVMEGNTALVGAPDEALGEPGSAYVFTRSGSAWTQQQKLQAADGVIGQRYGSAVAISGDTLLSGTPYQRSSAGEEAGSAYVYVLSAGTWGFQQKLSAGDGASQDVFGLSVSASGSSLLAGAPYDDTAAGIDTGSAYVFLRTGSTWQSQARLTASTAAANDYFGTSVALAGDKAVVGAPQIDPEQEVDSVRGPGKAYAFQRTGAAWAASQSLVPTDAQANDDFYGRSVAVSGSTAVVGAPRHDPVARANAGAAYVFVESGGAWAQQGKLLPSDSTADDQFGYAVAISGETALVGAPLDNSPNVDAGSAYAFLRSAGVWTQQQKLTATGAVALDDFGRSVSISGDTALVGSPLDDVGAVVDTGSAYVFLRTGLVWAQQARLNATGTLDGDAFGRSVAIEADTALVGAPADDLEALSELNEGSATVFVRTGTTWSQEAVLTAPAAASFDAFGTSVVLSANWAAVGAARDDSFSPISGDPRIDHGTVQIFRLGVTPLESWRVTHFGSSENSGNGADEFDFDRDGVVNLLEWAGNLNPTLASTFPVTVTPAGGEFIFLYSHSTAAAQAGAVFIVEWSDTLAALGWSSAGVTQTLLTDNGTLQNIQATVPAGSSGRRFVRLRVQAP